MKDTYEEIKAENKQGTVGFSIAQCHKDDIVGCAKMLLSWHDQYKTHMIDDLTNDLDSHGYLNEKGKKFADAIRRLTFKIHEIKCQGCGKLIGFEKPYTLTGKFKGHTECQKKQAKEKKNGSETIPDRNQTQRLQNM